MRYGSIGAERNPSRCPWWGRRPVSSWLVVVRVLLVVVVVPARVLAVIAAVEHKLKGSPDNRRECCGGVSKAQAVPYPRGCRERPANGRYGGIGAEKDPRRPR